MLRVFAKLFTLEPFTFILKQWKGSLFLFLPQNAWFKSCHFNQLCSRAFLFYIESMERLYGLVFAAKRMVKVFPL